MHAVIEKKIGQPVARDPVRRAIQRGELRYTVKIGRTMYFSEAVIDAWIAAHMPKTHAEQRV